MFPRDFTKRLAEWLCLALVDTCVQAYVIYKKFDDKKAAIGVLLENIRDLERAKDFATACNLDETWSTLANAQLNAGQVRRRACR